MHERGAERPLAEVSARLVEDVLADAPEAWERLVRRFAPMVHSVFLELGLPAADAEDLFQATWMTVHRHLRSLRRPGALPAWIMVTARRHALRHLRNRRRGHLTLGATDLAALDHEDTHGDTSPLDDLQSWEDRHLVHAALAELSPPCQELLRRLFLDPGVHTYEEVAAAMGMPLGSVGPRRIRCLARLAEVLRQRGWE